VADKLINDNQTLKAAKYRSGYEISVYDDGFGDLWISRNSIGINGIVRAKTWEDAYSICEDEFFAEATETVEELIKEYGFRRDHKTVETPDADAWPDNELFQEAFGVRPNGPNASDKIGHGIYSKDLNGDYLDPLTPELLTDLNITLDIETEEN
jgi:hypothetical protein